MSNQAKIRFTLVSAAGDEIQVELPAKFKVCYRCEGTGTHVNPAIDGNGLTQEDFDEDPDFHESYMSGAYDIRCQTCKGEKVLPEIDLSRCTRAQKAQWRKHQEEEAESARDWESERFLRMAESGERW